MSAKGQNTGLYESFNARNLSAIEVARTFVPPPQYRELWQNNNVLLLGPRGSGKTTLLKMLTHEALAACEQPEVRRAQSDMAFVPVYIPTDRHWYHFLAGSLKEVEQEAWRLQLSKAAVTTNVLYALCEAFEQLRDYAPAIALDEASEGLLVRLLAESWGLSGIIPRLRDVKRALVGRTVQLDVLRNKLVAGVESAEAVRELPEAVWFEFLSATRAGCEAFEVSCSGKTPRRWALCFDEMELAPTWLQQQVYGLLRSTDQRFVFKLSTAPIPEFLSASQASAKQDFHVIRLWRYRKSGDPYGFSERLTRSVLEEYCGRPVDPEDVFGSSAFQQQNEEGGGEYEEGGRTWAAMRSLASKDESFRQELIDRELSPADPAGSDPETGDQFLRKAKPLVLLRDYYVKVLSGGKSQLRSRKVHALYSGREAIYDVADNNPRWLIGILNELKKQILRDGDGDVVPIPRNRQARVLRDVADTYLALLKALPSSRVQYRGQLVDLVDLLEAIGAYFERVMLRDEFSLDPAGSVEVDEGLSDALLTLLRLAVYEGALVLVNPSEGTVDLSVEGRRLRLTHLLAPHFRLPLRLYSSVRLSTTLTASDVSVGESLQRALFSEE